MVQETNLPTPVNPDICFPGFARGQQARGGWGRIWGVDGGSQKEGGRNGGGGRIVKLEVRSLSPFSPNYGKPHGEEARTGLKRVKGRERGRMKGVQRQTPPRKTHSQTGQKERCFPRKMGNPKVRKQYQRRKRGKEKLKFERKGTPRGDGGTARLFLENGRRREVLNENAGTRKPWKGHQLVLRLAGGVNAVTLGGFGKRSSRY